MEWQPIETAPLDKDVILYCPNIGVVYGCWNDDRHSPSPRPFWTNDLAFTYGTECTRNNQPTHWMELPGPPKC